MFNFAFLSGIVFGSWEMHWNSKWTMPSSHENDQKDPIVYKEIRSIPLTILSELFGYLHDFFVWNNPVNISVLWRNYSFKPCITFLVTDNIYADYTMW